MSTPLEAWLEKVKNPKGSEFDEAVQLEEAIAVIEKLKEALERIDAATESETEIKEQALAIDPEKL